MKSYLSDVSSILEELKSSPTGLGDEEAVKRLETYGKNQLKEGKKVPLWFRFLAQLAQPMTIILMAAAIVSGITAAYAGESFADVIIIATVVIINAVLGVYQESKAEKAIEALKEMSSATSKVIRNGNLAIVKSEELVPGDVIALEAGDAVPADARIIECASLKAEEAALTGESVPVNKTVEVLSLNGLKDISLGDRTNMVYAGSSIVYGRARAVICQTGMNTEIGKIADALSNAKEGKTPLQQKLAQLSKILSFLVIGICVFIFIFSMIRNGEFTTDGIIDTFMIAVSLAVAAIPEGLATVVTIVLAIGVTNMSARNAVIRKLTAVETLGSTQIICSDKTGTLTQNKMTVVKESSSDTKLLCTAMSLCSDAKLNPDNVAVGEPTECALVNYAYLNGLDGRELEQKYPRIAEVPFDSERKMMSTFHQAENHIIQYTKGAPDEILKRCTKIWKDGRAVELTQQEQENVSHVNKEMADQALRVLAASFKEYETCPQTVTSETTENDMIFIGMTGMIDPVRPEVVEAAKECRQAGIRPIMITGDHRDTAIAIAKELGIITNERQAITGAMLNEMDDQTFHEAVELYSVYSRVQPEHKVRIVSTWQDKGKVVAMTGDGVNDAPSIKRADIGIGMGITGTDVTKNVADMVLADDNFATIVSAVKEGRRIYDNIRKSIQFLLSSNLSEVLAIFVATLLGFTILKPVHLLWINLLTDTFPALSLGMEPYEADVMKRKPRDPKEGIFAGRLGKDVIYQGVIVMLLTLFGYFFGVYREFGSISLIQSERGMTMAFLVMSFAEVIHACNLRSRTQSIFSEKTMNWYLILAMAVSFILTTAVMFIRPLRDAFSFTSITAGEYAISILLGCVMIPAVELVKAIRRWKK